LNENSALSVQSKHIVLVGFGNMGQALARGWLAAGLDVTISVVDPVSEARARAGALGMTAFTDSAGPVGPVDVAVLAVKPNQIADALTALPECGLYLSIAAGRSIADVANVVGDSAAIIRCMPNTPAAIGRGVSVLTANTRASQPDRELASRLMSAVGTVEWIDDEGDMDAVTAVSGSGPAYVFLLIECLTRAAVDAGLDTALAERLATATVSGAGAYAAASSSDAASLRRQVTSPNGTTAAALDVLCREDALRRLIREAVAAAARRSRELGAPG
jgi:pyrroline-5-carboxylate reductase